MVDLSFKLFFFCFAGNGLEEELPIKCIEPQSLTSQSKKSEEIVEDEGKTVKIDHSALGMTLEEALQHKDYTEAAERGE